MKYKLVIMSIFTISRLFASTIGSDTYVSRIDTLVTLNSGDRVAGFAALDGGFQLANASTVAEWDCFFGVRGPINLNGGTLQLHEDLFIRDVSSLQQLGTIWGNGNQIEIPDSLSTIPLTSLGQCFTFSSVDLFLDGDVVLQDCIQFVGNCLINGQGNVLTLSSPGQLIIASNSNLLLKDITIRGVHDSKILCTDSLSTITYKDVELDLDGNYTFTIGHFDVFADLLVVGSGFNFIYQSPTTSTVQPNARMIFDYGVTFSYDPGIASRDLLNLVDSTAQLLLNGATLFSTTTGLRLTKGQMIVGNHSFLSCDGFASDQRISFGDGISFTNNLTIRCLPAATLEVLTGGVVYNNV